jgi:alcohol dehydrogenase
VSEVLHQRRFKDPDQARERLVGLLGQWTARLNLPGLSKYGVRSDDLDDVVAHSRGSSMKTNPIVLTDAEIKHVLEQRL